jgi:predicted lipoprotein
MRRLLIGLAVLTVCTGPAVAGDPAHNTEIVARGISDYIRPAFSRFAEDAYALDGAVAQFCEAPSPDTRHPLDTAYRRAVEGWSGI